jgi:hypothetical protein
MIETIQNSPPFEMADILRQYWDCFAETHKVNYHHFKVIRAIMNCRTKILGGHIEKCTSHHCDYETNAYNSCRDRHCPKCSSSKRIKWVSDRIKELLPIPYYHFTCTLPPILHRLCLLNQAVIYDLFFKATSYALNAFSKDPKFLGAQIGFVGILHTWGKSLCLHPHIHYVITGGGLSRDKSEWIRLPYQNKFLFPAKAVSMTIRGKFVKLLKKAYAQGDLVFPGKLEAISSPSSFYAFCNQVGNQAWYCHSKRPFSGPEKVLEYIGRYTHRVAISNSKLINISNNRVIFKITDYKDKSRIKVTSLPVETFIRRFTWHILPHGFRKIRHFGFLNSGYRAEKIRLIRKLLEEIAGTVEDKISEWLHCMEPYLNHLCPKCHTGKLVFYNTS